MQFWRHCPCACLNKGRSRPSHFKGPAKHHSATDWWADSNLKGHLVGTKATDSEHAQWRRARRRCATSSRAIGPPQITAPPGDTRRARSARTCPSFVCARFRNISFPVSSLLKYQLEDRWRGVSSFPNQMRAGERAHSIWQLAAVAPSAACPRPAFNLAPLVPSHRARLGALTTRQAISLKLRRAQPELKFTLTNIADERARLCALV